MTDLLVLIRDRLVAHGVVNTTTWPCYINYAPDVSNQLVSLHLTGGFPEDTHGSENVIQTFELRIRAAQLGYTACEAKWWETYDHLQDADMSNAGIRLIQAMASGPMTYMDPENRVNMTMNFRVVRDRVISSI